MIRVLFELAPTILAIMAIYAIWQATSLRGDKRTRERFALQVGFAACVVLLTTQIVFFIQFVINAYSGEGIVLNGVIPFLWLSSRTLLVFTIYLLAKSAVPRKK